MSLNHVVKGLCIAILLLVLPAQVCAQIFYDVPNSFKYEVAINNLTSLGVINGYSDGSFQPEKAISRAEAIKILIAATESTLVIDEAKNNLYNHELSTPFPDVGNEEWFAPYVTLATQNGITQGYSDGLFKPWNTINMAEGLKMILETYGVDSTRARFVEHPLLLIGSNDWFSTYFLYSYNHNLINRKKFYHPAQKMSRGEFIETIYRLKTVLESGNNSYSVEEQYTSDEYTITIPKLNIINVGVSFADPFDPQRSLGVLQNGLGHYLSPPGGGHKMVLFGHSSGYSWDKSPFKTILTKMDKLIEGDLIYVNYKERGYAYQITQKEIRPATNMEPVMEDYGYEEMALYTCWPPNNISKRYVVYAIPTIN